MNASLSAALKRRGYDTLTSVQQAVTNPDLAMQDLLVSAQTGSGKTVGFGLAIAPTLLGDDLVFPQADNPLALIIAPTRELAMQVKRELIWLYEDARATIASCVGGMDMRDERRSLARGAHIVVATPGRLLDHINRKSIDLSDVRAIVLDEADEMLDLGFREDLEFILGEAPQDRQTLLFSATVPPAIAKLAKKYQRDAERVTTTEEKQQHADIDYRAMLVSPKDSENAVINVLRYYEAPNALVFCNTREAVNRLKTRLSNRGFSAVALSGELSQSDRTQALQAMRDGRARVCVATDVAARGIDLPGLSLVIHSDLPSNHETLLHRSGRTGRAGRKGTCALIVSARSRRKAERLLKEAKVKASWGDAPSADEVKERDSERLVSDPAWQEPIDESQQGAIDRLTEAFSPEQIAAAFLRLYHDKHAPPEELSDANAKPEPRAAFGPSTWFSVANGRNDNADPRRLLPMICKAGNLTKQDIGAIRIQQKESFFEIRQSSVDAFLTSIGTDMLIEDKSVRQLNKSPIAQSENSRSARRRPETGKFERRGKGRTNSRPLPRRETAVEADRPPGSTSYDPMDQAYVSQSEKPKSKKAHRKGPSKPRMTFEDDGTDRSVSENPPLEKRVRTKAGITPIGKPNSKKNKARAKAAADAKRLAGKKEKS